MSSHRQDLTRRSQRESLVHHELATMFLKLAFDDAELRGFVVNRVKLSADKSVCTIFLYIDGGHEVFRAKLGRLLLYKPSLRNALAQAVRSRYTPELVFRFDDQFEKQRRLDELLEKIRVP